MQITIDPTLEAELREQAAQRGQEPSRFAVAAAADLREVERQADSITDEESRELLMVSALENFVPRMMKALLESKDDGGKTALYGFFFMVLATLLFMSKEKQIWPSLPQTSPEKERHYTAAELLRMPIAERDRILRAQAERMAPLYEADLALPPHERELTAFTALDGVDPILEPDEYMQEYLSDAKR
jgi:hypothetical protein